MHRSEIYRHEETSTWKSRSRRRRIDTTLALFERELAFHSPSWNSGAIFILLILGEEREQKKKKKKKESSNDKRMLPGVLSARRDAIRESFEKVAIIKRAVPSVVLQ